MAKKVSVCGAGQPVDLTMLIATTSDPRLSLAQMLTLFDPDLHGGEVMVAGLSGKASLASASANLKAYDDD